MKQAIRGMANVENVVYTVDGMLPNWSSIVSVAATHAC